MIKFIHIHILTYTLFSLQLTNHFMHIQYFRKILNPTFTTKYKSTKIEEKKHGFSQLENGTQPPVSFRMHRSNILQKTITGQRWRGAARRVKVGLLTDINSVQL